MDFLTRNYTPRTFWTICIVNSFFTSQLYNIYFLKIIKNIQISFCEKQVGFFFKLIMYVKAIFIV